MACRYSHDAGGELFRATTPDEAPCADRERPRTRESLLGFLDIEELAIRQILKDLGQLPVLGNP